MLGIFMKIVVKYFQEFRNKDTQRYFVVFCFIEFILGTFEITLWNK